MSPTRRANALPASVAVPSSFTSWNDRQSANPLRFRFAALPSPQSARSSATRAPLPT
jgi:hypothetical protein